MRRPRKAINQINVVPYIDVMLVLLVIFMITAPLVAPGEIDLPSVGTQLTAPQQPITLTLKLDQSIQLQDPNAGNQVVKAANLDEAIALIRAKHGKSGEAQVVIAADKAARYEDVLKIIDRLKQSGVNKVGLLARPTAH
jgi:biopolymer transport protein TolR